MKTYKMTIAGLQRELPVMPVNDTVSIAAFILFGDTEITTAAATELLKKAPEYDILVTPEAKSIPLAYEMSRQSKKRYIVIRKNRKLYMSNPISVTVKSITTKNVQNLYLGENEADEIRNKRVLIVDDVISTGESLSAVKQLVLQAGGEIAGCCAILAEGEAANRKDIIFLEPLPIFKAE